MSSQTPGACWGQASYEAPVSFPAVGLQPEKRQGTPVSWNLATTFKLKNYNPHASLGLRPRKEGPVLPEAFGTCSFNSFPQPDGWQFGYPIAIHLHL